LGRGLSNIDVQGDSSGLTTAYVLASMTAPQRAALLLLLSMD
jgi:hypothetical protein